MTLLAIHDGGSASACLLEDGRIVAAIQEERLTRVKSQPGFPARAIRCVPEWAACELRDIDLATPDSRKAPTCAGFAVSVAA